MLQQADKVTELLAALPPLDKDGTLTGLTWEETLKILDGVLELGKDGISSLVGLLKEVDDGQDYRARYALHGLAQYLGRPGKEAPRALFAETLAAALAGALPKPVQGYLCRQLQVIGGPAQAPALGTLLRDEANCDSAAQALLAIRSGAVEEFRKALPDVSGKRRLTVIQALGVLKDADSVEALRRAASDPDSDTRLAAVWGLASIGDPGSVDIVLKASDVAPGTERTKMAHSCLMLAEKLAAAGKKDLAVRVYTHLRDTRTDASEAYLKDLAVQALGG